MMKGEEEDAEDKNKIMLCFKLQLKAAAFSLRYMKL